MIKRKSNSKKKEKNKEIIEEDITKEVGVINGFAIIEKLKEEKEEKKEEKKETEKKDEKETKKEQIDITNLDEKNKSFFKNWIIYDIPKESRFTKLFKELELKENEVEQNNLENIIQDEIEEIDLNDENVIYDNRSSNPSDENSRDSRAPNDNDNNINEEEIKYPAYEPDQNEVMEKIEKIEKKLIEEKKQEELKLNLEINFIISQKDKRSTLMIKNIPNKFNQEYILNIINQNFKGTFDVFVLPTDINKFKNFGYAFINFTSSYYIPYFYFMFNGKMWFGTNSKKVCELAYSKVQGKEALLEHYPSKIVFVNNEALEVTPDQGYIIPNIYKLYFNECFPKEKIEEYKYYFVTKLPN